MVKKIPSKAWQDGNPFYRELYKPHARLDRLRWQVARALHDGLPEEVRSCLIDELMTAEAYGEKRQFLIRNQTDQAINEVINAVKELAIDYMMPDGTIQQFVPLHKLTSITPLEN